MNSQSSGKISVRSQISEKIDLIIQYFDEHPEEITPKVLAQELGLKYGTVRKYCLELSRQNKLVRIPKGRVTFYRLPNSQVEQHTDVSSLDDSQVDDSSQGKLVYRVHKLRFRMYIRVDNTPFWSELRASNFIVIPFTEEQEYHQHNQK